MAVKDLFPASPNLSDWNSSWSRPGVVQVADGQYIKTKGLASDDYFFDHLPADATTVSQVDFYVRAKSKVDIAADSVFGYIKVGANTSTTPEIGLTGGFTTYVRANIPRPGGGPWTVADVNSMIGGVLHNQFNPPFDPAMECQVDQIFIRVTYDTAPVVTSPNAPSGLAANPISSVRIDLTWIDNSTNETGFNIYTCSSPGCVPSLLVATVGAGVVAYSAVNLQASSLYRFAVTAFNAGGESALSNVAEATTPAPAGPPAPVPPPPLVRPTLVAFYMRLAGVDDKLYCSIFDTVRRFRIDEFARVPDGVMGPQDGTRFVSVGFDITNSLPVLSMIESGFSGDPLSMVPERPPLSGDSWMYIGDRLKMRKVRAYDCLDLPIGLPIPPSIDQRFRIDEFAKTPDAVISSRDRTRFTSVGFDVTGDAGSNQTLLTLDTERKTVINDFETAGWTNNAGTGAGAPTNALDAADFKAGANSVAFTTNIGAGGGYNYWNKAAVRDLSVLDGGSLPASDDDIIHLWMKVDRPDLVKEIRLYLVCSAFDTATLPGTSTTLNTDAYVKAFTPDQFTPFTEAANIIANVVGTVGQDSQAINLLKTIVDTRGGSAAIVNAQRAPTRKPGVQPSQQLAPGRNQWTEFGIVGIPIYRGDFRRIGNDTTKEWKNITGAVVLVWSSAGNIIVKLDDWFLRGGRGLDSSQPGSSPYDYRVINYDPRTGDKSNGSAPTGPNYALDSLRRGITIHPASYGDLNVHQRFYRRGGTLVTNWYFVGENGVDGGAFLDTKADAEILNAGTLETDNDQPITTVDWQGNTILANPIPCIWGPVSDMIFGCGDRYRPGHLYWSKPGQPSHWPGRNFAEVCSPTEELMNGCVWAGQAYVFSRKRLFPIYPNSSVPGVVNAVPSACSHGLAGRWALVVTAQGVAFVATDGVYFTTGGPEQNISDADLFPIFHGESRGDYKAVSFNYQNDLRLEVHDNDLWFTYRDVDGNYNTLIYSLVFKYWRPYSFGTEIAMVYSEVQPVSGSRQLVMGGARNGAGYIHTGLTDEGTPIPWKLRTGALDQGAPRPSKRYGDLTVEVDRQGEDVVIGGFINSEAVDLSDPASGGGAPLTLNSGVGRQRYIVDLFGAAVGEGLGPLLARNVSVELSGEASQGRPRMYALGISYSIQPDTVVGRPTPWDSQGRLSDKYVKGLLIECDTGGLAKQLDVESDTARQTAITVTALGRQVVEFSFPQFKGRLLRLRPTDSVDWILYSMRWIFDQEPNSLDRWETQELDHGIPESQMLLHSHISMLSTQDVDLQITTYRESGLMVTHSYTIPATGGVKRKLFVPFIANKGVFSKYVFTSTEKFWLYREESTVWVQRWSGGEPVATHPFGNDDLDKGRGMGDAGLQAVRTSYGTQ